MSEQTPHLEHPDIPAMHLKAFDEADFQKAPINWLPATVLTTTFFAALLLIPAYAWFFDFSGWAWGLFVVILAANGLSITAGYHRLWAHRAYEAHWSLKWLFAFFGAMTVQNSILIWASGHRTHHRFVDDEIQDPYSARRGFWFSHVGWMLRSYPSGEADFSNAPDLLRDKVVMFQHKYYLAIVLFANIVFPVLLGWLLNDVWGIFLLAGLLRLVVSHHTTFFINSLAHIWGRRPYTDENTARDNDLLAFFTYGEGYHNYHHIFQYDYRNGIRWWQYDPTKWLIATTSLLGLTWNLKRTPDFRIQEALLKMQFKRARESMERSAGKSGKYDHVKVLLEQEYEHFRAVLAEWGKLKQEQYASKKQELREKWETAAIRTRFRELEFQLKMQRKRLRLMTAQFA